MARDDVLLNIIGQKKILESRIQYFKNFRRYYLILSFILLLLSFLNSNFLNYASDENGGFLFAIENTYLVEKSHTFSCNYIDGYYYYNNEKCDNIGLYPTTTINEREWPIKWLIFLVITSCMLFFEITRMCLRKYQEKLSELQNHQSILEETDSLLIEEIRGKYDISIVECPNCGRRSRVPAGKAFLAKCGECGEQWATQG